ncbi:MAG TPA: alpha/beta hydrolase [Fimbriimonas sp.]|nr:alpha/beta hydrolase [Fimbriimonas sp.]
MLSLLLPLAILMTQTQGAPNDPMLDVWPSAPPDGWTRSDQEAWRTDENGHFRVVSNVSHPTLEIFTSKTVKETAPTVLICPGGGYYIEAMEHEGWEIAKRLNKVGINAAVLKYRLPNRDSDKPLHKAPLQDAQRAIRLLRYNSGKYHIDPTKIGILGFSAGGHLAAVTSNTYEATYNSVDEADQLSPHPNFTVLIYPAYLEIDRKTELNPEITVTKDTPSVFIAQTEDDPIQVENAFAYALACRKVGVPAELHVWAKGGHGYGLRTKEPGLSTWPDLLIAWIQEWSRQRGS